MSSPLKPGSRVTWTQANGVIGFGTFVSAGADSDHALVAIDPVNPTLYPGRLVPAIQSAGQSAEFRPVIHCKKEWLKLIP